MSLEIHRDRDLTRANTLGLPSRAVHFVAPASQGELMSVVTMARERQWPLTLLGGGSNLILGECLKGLVVQPAFTGWWLEQGPAGSVRVHVEAGMEWHALVMALVERDLWGIENLALIPGHCGAAPIQNIGAYGVELAEVLEAVHLVYLDDGREAVLGSADCAFGYRDSIFKGELDGRVAITKLVLQLSRRSCPRLDYGDLARRVGPAPSAREVAEAVISIRREKLPDPSQLGNAGSFFKNPVATTVQARALLSRYPDMPHFPLPDGRVKLAAGWLIDQCGLKGYREGAFGVHDRQALVLVHHGDGNARELLAFSNAIAMRVWQRFGVSLEREPRLIGLADTA
ncbi:UDP-N-acetylenolpyruvoylglucosamine reductase [Litchfieldella qijiaojingensis]|uniref:UDP-N-acetylenolpyruvoylglucosamine reductase n=1 Tax=Litchfieldella qijiaojingensis TaxID=980347 RepID=A0ABQ2YFC5_9GAMM|nr:UDP-N-acetylmuramate dehydrogenase [Halomonas qijiaojingensis]GGX81409.1 UDP-N-acetylenolpyruvoylglucosamine reductase [Halomonas qijiaojingensis]